MLKETSFRSSSFSSCLACFLRSAPGGRGQGKGGGGTSHKPARRPHAFGGRVFTRCFRAELAHSPREPLRKEPHRKRGGGPSQMGEHPMLKRGGGGGTAEHPQALSHPSGRVRRGVPSPSPRVPGPPRRGAQPGTGASWLRGRGDYRSLRQTGVAGPQRRAEGTRRRFRPALTELCPGRTPRHAAAPSPSPSGPTRLPSSCCSPPPSLLSNVSRGPERPRRREDRTRASS